MKALAEEELLMRRFSYPDLSTSAVPVKNAFESIQVLSDPYFRLRIQCMTVYLRQKLAVAKSTHYITPMQPWVCVFGE